MDWISPREFDFEAFAKIKRQPRKCGNPSTHNRTHNYKNIICAFDIETSKLPFTDHSFLYLWQFQAGLDFPTVIGRTWAEWSIFAERLRDACGDLECVIYVHNLSYEFQFLTGVYRFAPEEVFAVKSRKILKCTMWGKLEFRCSYLHSNMSLYEFTHKMNVEHPKVNADTYDHTRYRTPDSELTPDELQYGIHDVLGLVEAITAECERDGDNLYTIPLTSTGYVRRDARAALRHTPAGWIEKQLPPYEVYTLLREAFRGGNTHANRYYVGTILHNVHSADRSSSYPDVQCNNYFPIEPFRRLEDCAPRRVIEKIMVRKRPVIMRMRLWGVQLRDKYWGCPYIPKAKCRNLVNAEIDNGRVLSCDYLEMTVTDIDYRIIAEEYTWQNTQFYDVWWSKYGKLPPAYTAMIKDYYRKKTELKGVPGAEHEYMRSKSKVNAIYGMSAQDPVKIGVVYNCNDLTGHPFNPSTEHTPAEVYEQYLQKGRMPYQWGVWTTAWARWELEQAIKLCGDRFVYCDTDSVKYFGSLALDDYNTARRAKSSETGSCAQDPKGVMHYMGEYEDDGEYAEFITLGAKKYAYTTPQHPDSITTTVAGVSKKHGGAELARKGGLAAFVEGFVFEDAGGTESVYNDHPTESVYINGREYPITPNVYIKPSTYTVGFGAEFAALLRGAEVATLGEALRKMYNKE